MNRILIKNAKIVNEGSIFEGDVLIENEFIVEIADFISAKSSDCKIIDAEGNFLIPGAIDDQVHFREPGLTHKGDIESESRAAVAGGVTSFIEQPNTIPNALTQDILEEKYQIAENNSFANYSFMMGASNDNLAEVLKTNPKNVAMSTHVNAMICFGLKSQFLFRRNIFTLGLDMTHFSNGATKVPNLGVNLPYFSVGYGRVIQKAEKDTFLLRNTVPFKKWLFGMTAIGSVKEIFPTNRKKYPVFALSTHFRYFSRPKVGFEAAFDIISKQAILGYKPEITKSQWDILQMGAYIGYLLPLDRLHFVLGMGMYIKDKYQPEDFMYHRVGMRYYFPNGLNAQVVLKSHWARADYVEWGLGYTFNFKKR
jgi:hypothetical protein